MDFNANREVTYSVYHPTQFTLTLYNDMNLKSGELTGFFTVINDGDHCLTAHAGNYGHFVRSVLHGKKTAP